MIDESQSEYNAFRELRIDLIEFLVMLEKNREKHIEQLVDSLKTELKEYILFMERKRAGYFSQSFDLLHAEIKKISPPWNDCINQKQKLTERFRNILINWLNKN